MVTTIPARLAGAASTLSNCYTPSSSSSIMMKIPYSDSNSNKSDENNVSSSSSPPVVFQRDNGDGQARDSKTLRKIVMDTTILASSNSNSNSNSRLSSSSVLMEMGHTKVVAQAQIITTSPDNTTTTTNSSSIIERGTLQVNVEFTPFAKLGSNRFGSTFTTSLEDGGGGGSSMMNTGIARQQRRQLQQEELDLSLGLQQALWPVVSQALLSSDFPKSTLQVSILVLQDDGGVFSTSCIASSLAICKIGIEMVDLVTSCSVATIESNDDGTFLRVVDPTTDEVQRASSVLTLAYMPHWKEVTYWQQVGMDEAEGDGTDSAMASSLELCRDGCKRIHALMRECLIQQVGGL